MMQLTIPPLRWYERAADVGLQPLMRLVAGTWQEAPQQTHWWNNHSLTTSDVSDLEQDKCVHCDHAPGSSERYVWGLPVFHIPILGGWRDYVVLDSQVPMRWHVGWRTPDRIGVSQICVAGPVRMLLGQHPVTFFGCNSHGHQIAITQLGSGRIGEGGAYAQTPLL